MYDRSFRVSKRRPIAKSGKYSPILAASARRAALLFFAEQDYREDMEIILYVQDPEAAPGEPDRRFRISLIEEFVNNQTP